MQEAEPQLKELKELRLLAPEKPACPTPKTSPVASLICAATSIAFLVCAALDPQPKDGKVLLHLHITVSCFHLSLGPSWPKLRATSSVYT